MTALDPVIKAVEAGALPGHPREKLVTLDAHTGKVIKDSIFDFLKSKKAFLISAGTRATRQSLRVVSEGLEVVLDYEAWCPPGQEGTVAERFFGGASPQALLEDRLEFWARTFIADREAEALIRSESFKQSLEDHLAAQVEEAFGLKFQADCRLEEPLWMRPKKIEAFHFQAQAGDAELVFDLCLEAELRVDPAEKLLASRRRQELEGLVERIPEQIALAARQLTLHQFYVDLGDVCRALEQQVAAALREVGWMVERFRLSGGPEVANLVIAAPFKWRVGFPIRDLSDLLPIEVEALLELKDLGAFVRAGRPSVNSGLEGESERLAREALFGLSLIQVRHRRDQIAGKIAEGLRDWARAKGYDAQPKVHLPTIAPPDSSRQFKYQVPYSFSGVAEPVRVRADFLAECHDVDRFARAGSPDISTWLAGRLQQAVTEAFFGKTYSELYQPAEIESLRKRLEESIAAEAEAIGLFVDQVIEIGNLVPVPLSEPVHLVVERPQERLPVPFRARLEGLLQLEDAPRFVSQGIVSLQAWIADVFARAIDDVLFDFKVTEPSTVRREREQKLLERLRRAASERGYQLEATIEIQVPDLGIPRMVSLRHRVSRSFRQRQAPLEALGDVVLQLKDAEKFLHAGRPDLAAWWQGQLEKALDLDLFGLTYAQLCLSWNEKKVKLSERLIAAAAELGYGAAVKIDLPVDNIGFLPVKVSLPSWGLSDATRIAIEAECVLELMDAERFSALEIPDMAQWLRSHLEAAAAEHLFAVTLSELSVRAEEKRREIEEKMVRQAREIGYGLEARIDFRGLLPGVLDPKKIDHSCACQLEGYPKEVQVQSSLFVQVESPETYLAKGCPDPEAWLRKRIDNLTREYLFVVSYTDLCIELNHHKDQVRQRIEQAAREIGCRVTQLITITDLLSEQLAAGVTIRFKNDFPSRLQGVAVGLGLEAEIRIADLHSLRNTIDEHPDLVAYMEKTIRRDLEQTLREMDPAEFYTEFQEPLPASGQAVSRKLEEIARGTLESFGSEILDVHCWPLETELSTAFKELWHKPHPILVKVERLQGEMELQFQGTVRVEGIAPDGGWHTFRQFVPKPEDLLRQTEAHLNSMLTDLSWGALTQTSNEELKAEIALPLQQRLARDFGITVTISDWRRLATELEKRVADKRLALSMSDLEESEMLGELIGRLKIQLYNQLVTDLGSDRAEKLQARIEMLEAKKRELLQGRSGLLNRLAGGADRSARALSEGSGEESR